ncbi:tRNA (adenine(58)-N(1))-methyltransferase, mitochondrial [Pelodytes ibericus]
MKGWMWQTCVGRALYTLRRASPGASSGVAWRHQVQGFVSTPGAPGDDDHGADSNRSGGSASGEVPPLPGIRRRIWRRSLSPLERVSQMMPPEFVSQELLDLRNTELNQSTPFTPPEAPKEDPGPQLLDEGKDGLSSRLGTPFTPPEAPKEDPCPQLLEEGKDGLSSRLGTPFTPPEAPKEDPGPQLLEEGKDGLSSRLGTPFTPPEAPKEPLGLQTPVEGDNGSPNSQDVLLNSGEDLEVEEEQGLPLGAPFRPGDLIVSEYKRRHYTEFKKLFLLTPSGKLVSNRGAISHREIVGKLPGQKFRTSTGVEFLLKRPTLDEYVSMMKRGPTISYPKDMMAMLMMMDVGPGDVVLEAGSGSGGLSLFLSRAVGSEGQVYSFDIRADHHMIAKKNFWRWKTAWENRCKQPWPSNVCFINKDVISAIPDIKSVTFDAVALDMLNPQIALPTILPNLKMGAVCSAYLANITQVIDLLEGIRSCQLSLVCEKIVEVSVKDWLVAPAMRKDGSVSLRVEPEMTVESELLDTEQAGDDGSDSEEDDPSGAGKPFGQVPYIARPMPWQTGHTAFLVQLRKFKPVVKTSQPAEPC